MHPKNDVIHICVPTEEEKELIQLHFAETNSLVSWHVTGIGVMDTSYHLSHLLIKASPAQILHVGIGGTYNSSLALGQVVEIREEQMQDYGAELEDGSHASALELVNSKGLNIFPWKEGKLINTTQESFPQLQKVSGLTVPYASGHPTSLLRRRAANASIESMEGAAVFYTCLMMKTSFHCLRAISNQVEVRNRSNWQVELACQNLASVIHTHCEYSS